MGFFQEDRSPLLIERRASRRTRATCAAGLRTLTNEYFGHLWDLSETGARISLPDPPPAGENGLLKWGTERVMCRIVWVERDLCGLEFEHPIDPAVVSASTRRLGIVEQPTAAMGNIPVGRKRSQMGASASRESDAGGANLLATRSRSRSFSEGADS
jgi:hypothetical protein